LAQLNRLANAVALMCEPVHRLRVLGKRRKDAQISAGAEGLAVARKNHDCYPRLVPDAMKCIDELGGHLAVDGVVLVRPVQRDRADRTSDLVEDGRVAIHGAPISLWAGNTAGGSRPARGRPPRPSCRSGSLPVYTPRSASSCECPRPDRRRRSCTAARPCSSAPPCCRRGGRCTRTLCRWLRSSRDCRTSTRDRPCADRRSARCSPCRSGPGACPASFLPRTFRTTAAPRGLALSHRSPSQISLPQIVAMLLNPEPPIVFW